MRSPRRDDAGQSRGRRRTIIVRLGLLIAIGQLCFFTFVFLYEGRKVFAPDLDSNNGSTSRTKTAVVIKTQFRGKKNETKSQKGVGKFLHTCNCLGAESDHQTPHVYDHESHPGLRWLHFPKTGTSFISTLWNYACDDRGTIDLAISPFLRNTCPDCYDHALVNRFPVEMYCRTRALSSMETQHLPLDASKQFDFTRSRNTANGASDFNQDEEVVVGFFRNPESRIVSAFNHGMHAVGIGDKNYNILFRTCSNNLTCYAEYPGISGCMTRMLDRHTCAVPPDTSKRYGSPSSVARAINAVRAMGFIGLTEEWNESICQFHRVFGGEPRQSQFNNVRKGTNKHGVNDFVRPYTDPADEAVYKVAVEEFHRRKGPKSCYQPMPLEAYEENSGVAGKTEKAAKRCLPKRCADLGMQCGEWPDGCGGVTICGVCNPRRDSLPETWRLECVEGQCVRTCHPWVQKGLWFQGDSRSHKEWISELSNVGAPIGDFSASDSFLKKKASNPALEFVAKKGTHLTPSDSVRICRKACTSQNATHQSFALQFCFCGNHPTTFVLNEPKEIDYHEVHTLRPTSGPKAFSSNPAMKAILNDGETQPKCCPPTPKRMNANAVLTKNAVWHYGTVVADFFQTLYLGCGGHDECERHGQESNATVVVFHRVTHLCHLGRNQGDLISPTDMLQNPFPRSYLRLVNEGSFKEGNVANVLPEIQAAPLTATRNQEKHEPFVVQKDARVWKFLDQRQIANENK